MLKEQNHEARQYTSWKLHFTNVEVQALAHGHHRDVLQPRLHIIKRIPQTVCNLHLIMSNCHENSVREREKVIKVKIRVQGTRKVIKAK